MQRCCMVKHRTFSWRGGSFTYLCHLNINIRYYRIVYKKGRGCTPAVDYLAVRFSWLSALHCNPCPAPCSPGPNPTPGHLMDITLHQDWSATIYCVSNFPSEYSQRANAPHLTPYICLPSAAHALHLSTQCSSQQGSQPLQSTTHSHATYDYDQWVL